MEKWLLWCLPNGNFLFPSFHLYLFTGKAIPSLCIYSVIYTNMVVWTYFMGYNLVP